jgi:hypothetical protein
MSRIRQDVGQYLKSWQPSQPSKTYFTDFAGGGVLYIGASYKWHIFTSSGFWVAPVTNADVIVVAGGGGTGRGYGGGGGAGGVRNLIASTFTVGASYTVTVGAAGTSVAATSGQTAGGNSSIVTLSGTVSATGGGRGASTAAAATNGGSGGGAGVGYATAGTGNAGGYSPVEGYNGGAQRNDYLGGGGGGGGASQVGGSALIEWMGGADYRNTSGFGGLGVALPNDCSDAPIFDNLRVTAWGSIYVSSVQLANLYVGTGGCGGSYGGCYTRGTTGAGGFASSISGTYNDGSTSARSYGCGGASTDARPSEAKGGIVIVRYAL